MAMILQLLSRAVQIGAVAVAVAYILVAIGLMFLRVPYPFELNWMEGAMVDHVNRVAAGLPIYVEPSLEFTPFIYPPGFYYASAALTPFFGPGFAALRVVSALSSVGVLALVGFFVWRETGSRHLGVIAAGLWAATYEIGGAWFDVGRVDMLYLLLVMAAFALLRFGRGAGSALSAALLFVTAVLTKQSALVTAAPVVLWVLLCDWRRGLAVAVPAAAGALAVIGVMDWVYHGWYSYYVFDLPSAIQFSGRRALAFWTVDMLGMIPVGLVLAALYLVTPPFSRVQGFHVCMAAGLVLGSWISRAQGGGNSNVLIPAFVAFAILAALGLHAGLAWSRQAFTPDTPLPRAWPYLAAAVQMLMLWYNPADHRPHESSVTAGHQVLDVLRHAEGDVWVPYHGYLARAAGKRPYAHWMAMTDILRDGRPELRAKLRAEVDEAVRGRRFSMIVLSSTPFPITPQVEPSYTFRATLFEDPRVFWPLSGARRRPERIYVPARLEAAP